VFGYSRIIPAGVISGFNSCHFGQAGGGLFHTILLISRFFRWNFFGVRRNGLYMVDLASYITSCFFSSASFSFFCFSASFSASVFFVLPISSDSEGRLGAGEGVTGYSRKVLNS
jgi:hypothetical protein